LMLSGISEVFLVYPDGPVTLSLPVKATGDGSATVKVSYMACSIGGCLAPTAKTLDIALPSACQIR